MVQNPSVNFSLLWITDPWETLDLGQDTTLRLGSEAWNRSIPSYWSSPALLLDAPRGHLRVIPFPDAGNPDASMVLPVEAFSQIHYRIDPPVDESYRALLEDLKQQGVHPGQILNPPDLIAFQSEKLPPPDLLDLAPRHQIIRNEQEAHAAFLNLASQGPWVKKPMNLAQSIGVERFERTLDFGGFLGQIRTETADFTNPLLVEEYLPAVMTGEVRLWFAMGEFVAALKKFPKAGDFRVLIDQGSRIEAHMPNPRERAIASRIGGSLKSQGIALAAVDLIEEKISDYNITSPGLLVQLERVHGNATLAGKVIELLLRGF